MKFDIPKSFVNFESAILLLKASKETSGGKFVIYPVKTEWNEQFISWNRPDNVRYWLTPGLSNKDYHEQLSVEFEVSSTKDYIAVDITNIAKHWISGNPNNGIVMKPLKGSLSFYSKESENPPVIVFVV